MPTSGGNSCQATGLIAGSGYIPFNPIKGMAILQALAILRGEMPTRKRAIQYDTPEVPRHRPAPFQSSSPSNFFSPALGSRPPFPFQDQSLNSGEPYVDTSHWPQQGPYIMSQWRQAIQK